MAGRRIANWLAEPPIRRRPGGEPAGNYLGHPIAGSGRNYSSTGRPACVSEHELCMKALPGKPAGRPARAHGREPRARQASGKQVSTWPLAIWPGIWLGNSRLHEGALQAAWRGYSWRGASHECSPAARPPPCCNVCLHCRRCCSMAAVAAAAALRLATCNHLWIRPPGAAACGRTLFGRPKPRMARPDARGRRPAGWWATERLSAGASKLGSAR